MYLFARHLVTLELLKSATSISPPLDCVAALYTALATNNVSDESMRLLRQTDDGEFSLTQDLAAEDAMPPYAILSHTWGTDDEEVTFEDIAKSTGKTKPGYQKIRFCGQQASLDGLQHFWIDTCRTI